MAAQPDQNDPEPAPDLAPSKKNWGEGYYLCTRLTAGRIPKVEEVEYPVQLTPEAKGVASMNQLMAEADGIAFSA